jgi:P27 family predicted phage terminase small subunit
MGRPAKTREMHLLQGTLPQGTPDKVSYVRGGRPKFPPRSSKEEKAEFKRLCAVLAERRTLSPGDRDLIAVYVSVWSRWMECKKQIAADGLMVTTTVTDSHGNMKTVTRVHPLLKIIAQCETRMLSLLKELGTTPATRDKVRPTQGQQESAEPVEGTVNWIIAQHLADKKRIDNDNLPA